MYLGITVEPDVLSHIPDPLGVNWTPVPLLIQRNPSLYRYVLYFTKTRRSRLAFSIHFARLLLWTRLTANNTDCNLSPNMCSMKTHNTSSRRTFRREVGTSFIIAKTFLLQSTTIAKRIAHPGNAVLTIGHALSRHQPPSLSTHPPICVSLSVCRRSIKVVEGPQAPIDLLR